VRDRFSRASGADSHRRLSVLAAVKEVEALLDRIARAAVGAR
jgi:hypothetical protein